MHKQIVWLLAGFCLALGLIIPTQAQSTPQNLQPNANQPGAERRLHGYGFVAPVFTKDGGNGLQTGFGVEGLVYKGLGVGGELGYLGSFKGLSNGVGVFSANGSYHFQNASKLTPFVTGGYSMVFRSGAASGFNVGGGINYWFQERLALRTEVRAQAFAWDLGTTIYSVRLGVTFR